MVYSLNQCTPLHYQRALFIKSFQHLHSGYHVPFPIFIILQEKINVSFNTWLINSLIGFIFDPIILSYLDRISHCVYYISCAAFHSLLLWEGKNPLHSNPGIQSTGKGPTIVQSDAPAGTFLFEHVTQKAGIFGGLDIPAVRMRVASRLEKEES